MNTHIKPSYMAVVILSGLLSAAGHADGVVTDSRSGSSVAPNPAPSQKKTTKPGSNASKRQNNPAVAPSAQDPTSGTGVTNAPGTSGTTGTSGSDVGSTNPSGTPPVGGFNGPQSTGTFRGPSVPGMSDGSQAPGAPDYNPAR